MLSKRYEVFKLRNWQNQGFSLLIWKEHDLNRSYDQIDSTQRSGDPNKMDVSIWMETKVDNSIRCDDQPYPVSSQDSS